MRILEVLHGCLAVFLGMCWVDRTRYVAYVVFELDFVPKPVDIASFYIGREDVTRLGI